MTNTNKSSSLEMKGRETLMIDDPMSLKTSNANLASISELSNQFPLSTRHILDMKGSLEHPSE